MVEQVVIVHYTPASYEFNDLEHINILCDYHIFFSSCWINEGKQLCYLLLLGGTKLGEDILEKFQ